MIVENGWGDGGWNLRINDEGQLRALAEQHTEARHHSALGEVFMFGTDHVPISDVTSFSGVFYIKNTSTTKSLFIGKLRTCCDRVCEWKMYRGVSAGTLVSSVTAALESNMNFSSAITFDGDAHTGGNARTVTDGTQMASWTNNVGHSQPDFSGSIILGPNDSFALTTQPQSAGDICVTMEAWQNGT